jgi:hypothetical protein
MVSRRLAALGLALIIVSACGGSASEPIDATAYSQVDGVETWDLTGEPSDAAFGIEGDSSAGIYETDEPRAVRVVLPGRTIEMDAVLVSFYNGGNNFTFGVRSAQIAPEPLTAAFREALGQLDVDTAPADDLAQQMAATPADQVEQIDVGAESVVLGGWSVGAAAGITPLAGSGRVIFSGSWPPVWSGRAR